MPSWTDGSPPVNMDRVEDAMIDRRTVLRWLAATPGATLIGGAVAGCGDDAMQPMDAAMGSDGGPGDDAGLTDAGVPGDDASLPDAGGEDAGPMPTCEPTTPDATGPFFEGGAPVRTVLAPPSEPGERLLVEGRLLRARDCRTALPSYSIDIWQCDENGVYHGAGADYRLRGRVVVASDGSFQFETIRPGNYALGDSFRPAHIHFRVYTPDMRALVTSQLYFEGDPFLGDNDPCQPPTCFSNDPDRIMRLTPAMIDGRMGSMGMFPIFVDV